MGHEGRQRKRPSYRAGSTGKGARLVTYKKAGLTFRSSLREDGAQMRKRTVGRSRNNLILQLGNYPSPCPNISSTYTTLYFYNPWVGDPLAQLSVGEG